MKRDDIVAFPYTNAEIAAKIDFTPDYAAAICYLLEHGEERLLIAIERGLMPANIAMEIARNPDGDVQRVLSEAYSEGELPEEDKSLLYLLENRQ